MIRYNLTPNGCDVVAEGVVGPGWCSTRGPGDGACADCPPVSRPSGFASVPVADVVLVGT